MMLPWKPKLGSAPGYVQQLGKPGPMEPSVREQVQGGLEMAAQRLIDGVKSGDSKSVLTALRNFIALVESEETETEME